MNSLEWIRRCFVVGSVSIRRSMSSSVVKVLNVAEKNDAAKNIADVLSRGSANRKTLEREASNCEWLIIWTDGDREGENIGFEIREVCLRVAPRLKVLRAKFSEITRPSIENALRALTEPDEKQSKAVDVRQQLDLRIGAAFTRFQTLRLAKKFPSLAEQLISYGSCQFPTMGFVVERYKAIEAFVPEAFWKIKVTHEYENTKVEFSWKRVRLFDQVATQVYHDICTENPVAKVEDCKSKPKSKWRPLPLDTVELEKLASRKLHISAKVTMQTAEKLYTSGFISYPRTETNIYPKELNLSNLVEMQTQSPQWGDFASVILEEGPNPRKGKKSDQAHPPIHPTKFTNNLNGNEGKLYEFIVRHFLASVSKDAIGKETTVNIDINGEKFIGHGLTILERNYLKVYPYERWSDKEILNYEVIEEFEPTSIDLVAGSTSPPNLLTEADLISLMDKHGIGTDATHAEHIETIKNRNYVGLQDNRFVPGQLGIALCDGYDAMGFEMSKPHLRSSLEADLKAICEGTKIPEVVLQEQINNYKNVFEIAVQHVQKIDEACIKYLNESPRDSNDEGFFSMSNESRFTPTLSQTIKCKCDLFAAEKTVVKEGPNKGRKFYCCNAPMSGANRCDFFQWVDEPPLPSSSSATIPSNSSLSNDSSITCNCGKVAAYRTVQKEGSNKGRFFYSCPVNMAEGSRCNFFKWADEVSSFNNNTPSTSSFNSNSQPAINDENSLTCNCGNLAIKKTVSKEGPNKGREFWVCSKPFGSNEKCQFFKWTDEVTNSHSNPGNFNGNDSNFRRPSRDSTVPSRGGGGGLKRSGSTTREGGSDKKKRRCGLCHREGHTRNKCPNNR
ncbi:DNA topoisomerase 3-alpha isoform X2 [Lepeophtheirus salmonis]|uniref:DNA topoisomerase 3-alpha isoform X2 n=1 Tax=Lepeophtheirus salmonis TaxID=72036 RepID=UPI001AE48A36|nr:DNA topoisomerase 3-alpha-like isoform X2 [Lepeophtheirus salmonis]